ncbi:MAG: hypothetical protein NZ455_05330 [Bacteroidia bacterium]|nr:hypothetical protein [Bacteroidia bacterium]MDW8346287.1 hypothetical protein [Bacteroidia bacterium]
MQYLSRPLPVYLYALWVFTLPTLIGLGTQSIIAFWIFLSIMAFSYFLYARNFYVIYQDTQNLYAKNPVNIFANKYVIPLRSIKKYEIYHVGYRSVLVVETHHKQVFFIPCYRVRKRTHTKK